MNFTILWFLWSWSLKIIARKLNLMLTIYLYEKNYFETASLNHSGRWGHWTALKSRSMLCATLAAGAAVRGPSVRTGRGRARPVRGGPRPDCPETAEGVGGQATRSTSAGEWRYHWATEAAAVRGRLSLPLPLPLSLHTAPHTRHSPAPLREHRRPRRPWPPALANTFTHKIIYFITYQSFTVLFTKPDI